MLISGKKKEGFHLFTLKGQFWRREDIDFLEQQVSVCIKSGRPWVILDLERLSFINSEALGLFVRLHNRCAEAAGKLILYRPESSVREVIEIADLPKFIALAYTATQLDDQMGMCRKDLSTAKGKNELKEP